MSLISADECEGAPALIMMMIAPHQQFLERRRFGALDGLRGLSILAVIWHHTGAHQTYLGGQGHLGVRLFFVISGFLITTLLLRELAQSGTISLRRFYIRRTLRIFPLYYLALAIYALLTLAFERHTYAGRAFFGNLPYFLTYTSNWFVPWRANAAVIFVFAWSLATEEQFYLFWPPIVRFCNSWIIPVSAASLLIAANLLARAMVLTHTWDAQRFAVRVLLEAAPTIALGCLLAYALHYPRSFNIAWRVLGGRWSSLLFAAAMLACAASPPVPAIVIDLSMMLFVGSVCIQETSAMSRPLSFAPLCYVGMISYGIYLLHMLIMPAARSMSGAAGWGVAGIFVLATLMSVAVASVSFWTFERWFNSQRDRFRSSGTINPPLPLMAHSPDLPTAPRPAAA